MVVIGHPWILPKDIVPVGGEDNLGHKARAGSIPLFGWVLCVVKMGPPSCSIHPTKGFAGLDGGHGPGHASMAGPNCVGAG